MNPPEWRAEQTAGMLRAIGCVRQLPVTCPAAAVAIVTALDEGALVHLADARRSSLMKRRIHVVERGGGCSESCRFRQQTADDDAMTA